MLHTYMILHINLTSTHTHTPIFVMPSSGIRMHSNEYHPTRVEHQRRKKPGENPYVTNIAMHRHKGMATTATAAAVKPTDSFEDLTGDFEELKIQSADFSKSA